MHTELSYPHPATPELGQVATVAPGVHWLRMPLPFALDHINLWLIDDAENQVALVDTGFASPQVQAAWREALRLRLPSRLIVTHFHPDHFGLADWLMREWRLELWMSHSEFLTGHAVWHGVAGHSVEAMLSLFRANGLDEERATALEARGNAYRRGAPRLPERLHRLHDGDELVIGGRTWRVITGCGHSPEHVALYCPSQKLLISGDMLLPKISTNVGVWAVSPEDDPLADFLRSLGRFEALPEDTLVLPSHGLPFVGLHARIAQLRAHHEERLAVLEAALETPKTAAEVIPTLFSRALDTHQVVFALGEALAHLNHLVALGRAERLRGPDGQQRFVRTGPTP